MGLSPWPNIWIYFVGGFCWWRRRECFQGGKSDRRLIGLARRHEDCIIGQIQVPQSSCGIAYCRGFSVLGAFVARLRSASVSATISVRPFLPGSSIIVMTSWLLIHSARCASYFMPYASNTGSV